MEFCIQTIYTQSLHILRQKCLFFTINYYLTASCRNQSWLFTHLQQHSWPWACLVLLPVIGWCPSLIHLKEPAILGNLSGSFSENFQSKGKLWHLFFEKPFTIRLSFCHFSPWVCLQGDICGTRTLPAARTSSATNHELRLLVNCTRNTLINRCWRKNVL